MEIGISGCDVEMIVFLAFMRVLFGRLLVEARLLYVRFLEYVWYVPYVCLSVLSRYIFLTAALMIVCSPQELLPVLVAQIIDF